MAKIKVEEHTGMAYDLAIKWHKTIRKRYEFDDILQTCMVGLVEAGKRFDETKGCQFSTYAYRSMNGAMMNLVTRDKRYVIRKQLKDGKQEYEILNQFLSLNYKVEDDEKEFEEKLQYECFTEQLINQVYIEELMIKSGLDEKEKKVIADKFIAGKTQKEIAISLNCSQPHAGRILRKALGKLREIA